MRVLMAQHLSILACVGSVSRFRLRQEEKLDFIFLTVQWLDKGCEQKKGLCVQCDTNTSGCKGS